MAGGGVGTPQSVSPAAPTPSGLSLDGSPKFEAAAPVAASSNPAAGPAAGVMPAARPGMNFTGLPPWMSAFFGGQMGGPSTPSAPSAGTPSSYVPFVPGTSLSGYGMARDRVIYQPPSKPAAVTEDPNKSASGIPEYYNFADNPNYLLYSKFPGFSYEGTGIKAPTKEQIAMQQWLDNDARNRAIAASQAANANGSRA